MGDVRPGSNEGHARPRGVDVTLRFIQTLDICRFQSSASRWRGPLSCKNTARRSNLVFNGFEGHLCASSQAATFQHAIEFPSQVLLV
jgi:hypothetical protein